MRKGTECCNEKLSFNSTHVDILRQDAGFALRRRLIGKIKKSKESEMRQSKLRQAFVQKANRQRIQVPQHRVQQDDSEKQKRTDREVMGKKFRKALMGD